MTKIALIWCDPTPEAAVLKDGLEQAFRSDGQTWDVLSPKDENFGERATGYDGYVISGSPRSVVEDADSPMVRRTLDLIRHVQAESDAPIVGVCFGAQSLAQALGGNVGRNTGGDFKLGVDDLDWTAEAGDWTETGVRPVLVQSHGECVLTLPPESVRLASSATTSNEIFLTENRFLGVQGHPEVDTDLLKSLFMAFHRSDFEDERWRAVEVEAERPLEREPVKTLGRRLLAEGVLAPRSRTPETPA